MKAFVCFTLALLVAFTAFGHVPSGIEGGYDHKTGWTPANATFSHTGIVGGTVATFNFGRDCQTLLEPRTGYTAATAQAAIKAAIASRWPDSVFPYTDPNTTNPTTSQIQAINNQYIREYQDCRDDIHYHWSISNTPASKRNRLEIAWTWIRETVHMTFIITPNRPRQFVQLTISPSTGANVERPNPYDPAEITFWRNGTYTVTGEVTVDGQTLTAQETIIYPRPEGDWGNDDRIRPPVEKSVEPEPKTSLQQFEPVEIIYLEATEPKPAPQQQERTPVERAPVPKGAEVAPTAESTEPQLALGDGKESVPYTPTYEPELQPIPDPHVSYSMTFPAGVNSLHLPCKPRKSFFFTDLVNLLGDVNVNSISALRPTVQQWTIITSSHSVHNEWISPQRGFVADMKNTVTVDLVREPDGGGVRYDVPQRGTELDRRTARIVTARTCERFLCGVRQRDVGGADRGRGDPDALSPVAHDGEEHIGR